MRIVLAKINEQEATDKSSTNQFDTTLNTQVFVTISTQPSRRHKPRLKEVRTRKHVQSTTVNLNSQNNRKMSIDHKNICQNYRKDITTEF